MSNPTVTYDTRPATEWDLLAIHHAFIRGGTVESHWHTGPEAGRIATWIAHPVRTPGSGDTEVRLVHPSDRPKDSMESLEIDFDYLDTPDKAERHLVHADLCGVTFREIDHSADTYRLIERATYRLTDDAPRYPYYTVFTGEELYAQSERTFTALADAMTALGFPAAMRDVDMGSYVCLMSANETATRGYRLIGAWASGPDMPRHWMLVPVYKDTEIDAPGYAVYDPDEWKVEYHDLGLPLGTPVDDIAVAAAGWLSEHAPELRAS